MAFKSIGPFCTSFVIIQVDGDGVPISFLLGSDGLASISAIHLGLWFQLNTASLHIDMEVFDSVSGDFSDLIGQIPV